MTKCARIVLLAACLSLPAFADSIDDAEAKKRGVTPAQVQAENALAKEKARTADLEKKVADLQKKLVDLSSGDAPKTK